PPPATPQSTLTRYREALEREDPQAAYQLLSASVQQTLSYEQFAKEWRDTAVERAAQARQLRDLTWSHIARAPSPSAAASGPPLQAMVTLVQGTQVTLAPSLSMSMSTPMSMSKSRGPGEWRVTDPELGATRTPTPEAALRL